MDFANPDNPFGDPWYATPTGASHRQPFNNALGLPPPLPPAAAPPAPGQQPWRTVNDVYKPYYTSNPAEAWRQYIGGLVQGGTDSAFGRYVANQYGQTHANYLQAAEGNQNLQWTDYLTPDLLAHLKNNFGLQSSADQGQQWGPNVWAGRWVG